MDPIESFLASPPFAVVGASRNRRKYGNKVLRCYLQNDLPVVAVNPRAEKVEGVACYPDLCSIPGEQRPNAISIITPPAITEQVVAEAIAARVTHIWMQPGAESPAAVKRAEDAGLTVISGGPCLLVTLGYRES